MALVIKQANYAHLDAMAHMEARAWRESYQGLLGPSIFDDLDASVVDNTSHWAELMQQGHYFWIVTEDDGRVLGIAHAGPPRDDDAPQPLELTTMYLLEEAKGTGVGSALLKTAIGDSPAYLWVLEGNDRAIAFYTKEGFELDGLTRIPESMKGARELRMVRAAE
ncbi:GNAT family N-acetyltransferase [Luteococcus sanguinis]|uniref:GNAT family N-acetyltransferase n=1 Tax=Luteococcus sanguinis TaxID=174038 RepID=A0ABW1X0C8_9ACTN